MGYGKITAKQQEILDYIKDEILKKGYPPTVREICETVHLKSTSSVHSHLETLEKNGYIRRDPTKPRAIEICDDSFQMVRTEVVSLPVVGGCRAADPGTGEYRRLFPCACGCGASGGILYFESQGRFHDQCRYFQWRPHICKLLQRCLQRRHGGGLGGRFCHR